jgi:excisionase family DNA binding protein
MTTMARTTLSPRYGSPAEVAAFLGVSVKTVRRALESGTMPSYRIGRRVLIAYRDADQLVRRKPTVAIANPTETPLIDPATGRLRPMSDEERRDRSARLQRTLEGLGGIADETDTDENWAEVFRGLDAARAGHDRAGGDS